MNKPDEDLNIDQELLDAMAILGWRKARDDFPWVDVRVSDPDIIPDPISFDKILERIEAGDTISDIDNVIKFDPSLGDEFERMAARNRGDPIPDEINEVMKEDRRKAVEEEDGSTDK